MRLSAIDIKKQEFKKSFKGYDVSEVEAYLDTVANELEKIFRENDSLKEQISSLEKEKENLSGEIQVFRDNEKTFQKAIVKSQDLSEDIIENATKRAELIVKEAEIISSKTKLQAQEEIMNLRQELEELRIKNENIIEDIRNYLIEKLNLIEEYSKNRKIFHMDSDVTPLTNVSTEKEEEQKDFGIDLNIDESK
ncbi:MAG: DivIVA domain-containing protein [Ignavibacteria bacterium]|jgi:cell division initiation protein